MKTLLFLAIAAVMTVNANAAIVCKKEGRFWYPANAKSAKIASMLGVKTCNGKRFKKVVAQLGETSNVKAAKKRMKVEDVLAAFKK